MLNMMKKLFMLFLIVFFPWVLLLIKDNPGGAFIALILQTTVIGWPFASVWAWRTEYPPKDKTTAKK